MKIIHNKTIPFTKDAYEHMRTELKRLITEREETMKRLQIAREMGDLSENGAYKYAKIEIGNLNRRLRELRILLNTGFIQEIKSRETVDFGTTVTVEFKGKPLKYLMVTQHESNPLENKLSMESPIGAALMGKRIGETVTIQVPAGEVVYTITAIE